MSLRARLLITLIVLIAAGLTVAGAATYRLTSNFLVHRIDDQLEAAKPLCAAALFRGEGFGAHEGPGPVLPPGTYAEFRDGSGQVVSWHLFGYPVGYDAPARPALPATLQQPADSVDGSAYFTVGAAEGQSFSYRVLAAPQEDGTLVVAIPLTEVAATLDRLVGIEVIVGAISLLLVAGVALWLVRLGLRPLTGIGETAGAIAAGDLSRRVEPANERTEVGRLGLALNAMLSQIEAAFEERRASERRLRRFVADASHELRTPLTSIRGYAELFRRGAGSNPADLAKAMRRIEEEGARMGILVDDLLLLARLDQGRPLEREPVDLGRVAEQAIDAARVVEPDRPIDLRLERPAIVIGDEARLRQVLDNLLDNVRVHTPKNSSVRVAVEPHDAEVVLTVSDEGPGISPDVADRVFERFYRGDPVRSRQTGGAGLGLAIVAAIVQAHGGRASVTSPDGAGAAFEIRLPEGGATADEELERH